MVAKARKRKVQRPAEPKDVQVIWRVSAYLAAIAIFTGALFFAGDQLSREDVLPITELRVVGEFNEVNVTQLKEILVREIDGNFFTVDVDRIHSEVVDLPWVHFAWVDRIWPNTLQLRVVEEKPVAYLDGVGLVNSDGDVFVNVGQDAVGSLPVLKGAVEERKALLAAFTKYDSRLRAYGNALAHLEINERGSWRLLLQSGTEILVGQDGIEHRLSRFLDIFGDKLMNNAQQYERIDLRYANGFALSGSENTAQAKQSLNVVS